MLKTVGLIFLGVLFEIGGITCLYFFFVSLNNTPNMVYLIATLLLSSAGVFLFIKEGKSDKTVVMSMPPIKPLEEMTASAESRLAKNNEMLGDWKKTNETKDRLRMLELQSNAENGK